MERNHPGAFRFGAILALLVAAASLAGRAAEPYLRVGVFVEVDGGASSEWWSYSPGLEFGENRSLRILADTNDETDLMVLVVDQKTRGISPAWLPRIYARAERFEDVLYPEAEAGIPYGKGTALDVFVVALPEDSEGYDRLKKEVTELHQLAERGEEKEPIFLLKADHLRKKVAGWFSQQNRDECVPQYRPPAKAATQRSGAKIPVRWKERDLVHRFTIPPKRSPFVFHFPVSAK